METIDQDGFETVVRNSDNLSLVVFSAAWCRPCNMMTPVLEALEEDYADVTFVKIDIEEDPDLADEFEITSVPTFVMCQGEEVKGRKVGMLSKKELVGWLEDNK